MSEPQVAPYGSWRSPITSQMVASESVGLTQLVVDGGNVYWIEMRPSEGGRYVIVCLSPDGRLQDVTPSLFNARTRVNEYGGGSYLVAEGVVYFSNFTDQRLYRQRPDAVPQPITPKGPWRYADGVYDAHRRRIICVCEDHSQPGQEAVNSLVSVALEGVHPPRGLVAGNDFYAAPRLSPDGQRLAWLTWNHPNMPWDGTELWVGEIDSDGSIVRHQLVAGGSEVSIFQPEWSPEGRLYFVSDVNGWWNLYRWEGGKIEPVLEMEAEFGRPQWIFGLSTYGFLLEESLLCTYTQNGFWHLARIQTSTGELEKIASPYTQISELRVVFPDLAVIIAGSPSEAASVVGFQPASRNFSLIRRSTEVAIDEEFLSSPEPLEFPTENDLVAHAFFYRPKNRDFTAPPDELPPLLVVSHGGPTSATRTHLNLAIQYWTSRGFGVVDVNYGGSTGYGRAYRQRLNGQWGVVDVEDCLNAARTLVARGEADGNRLAIRGGSAGGYTTLCALTFHDVFRAGASYYGVSDLEALTKETHKFESRYLDQLIGPYPEKADLYRQRSPIHFTERLRCPAIFFQGLEDKVVPPNQTERMVEALRQKGVPVAYVPFEGEQHGFRRAENIRRSLEAELYFYSRVFGFELAESIEPVSIENL